MVTDDSSSIPDGVRGPNYLFGLVGGVAGGVLGYLLFWWLMRQQMYAMVLPGSLVGLGCGFLLGGRSRMMGFLCAVGAITLAILCQWHFLPFAQDNSLQFLLVNFHKLPPVQLLMIAVGVVIAYWFGQGRGP